MITVVDLTDRCAGYLDEQATLHDRAVIWIHRLGPSVGADAIEMARFFQHGPGAQYTGGRIPYHYLNTEDQMQQALPLDQRGAHARSFGNAAGLGLANLGDFRRRPPHPRQWNRAVQLCCDLLPSLLPLPLRLVTTVPPHLRNSLPVWGHGEVPAAFARTSQKDQPDGRYACPGRHWPMREFRQDVQAEMTRRAVVALRQAGHRLHRVA